MIDKVNKIIITLRRKWDEYSKTDIVHWLNSRLRYTDTNLQLNSQYTST